MKCINCVYHYITPEDKYPRCHFEPIADWDKAPCEDPEEKFRAGTVVYKDDKGDCTHHPDAVYHMNADGKYKKSGLYDDDKYEVFQWLLSIAGMVSG